MFLIVTVADKITILIFSNQTFDCHFKNLLTKSTSLQKVVRTVKIYMYLGILTSVMKANVIRFTRIFYNETRPSNFCDKKNKLFPYRMRIVGPIN